jgi:hypothetical protein
MSKKEAKEVEKGKEVQKKTEEVKVKPSKPFTVLGEVLVREDGSVKFSQTVIEH